MRYSITEEIIKISPLFRLYIESVFTKLFLSTEYVPPANVIYVDNSATAISTCNNGDTDYDISSRSCGVGGTETVYTDLQSAANVVAAGDTVLVRGGDVLSDQHERR